MKKIFVAMAVLGTVLLSSCVREKEFHNKNIKMGENEIAFVMKDVTTRSADEAAPAIKGITIPVNRVAKEGLYLEETIEYLMESLEGLHNYHNAAYIRMPYINNDVYREITRKAADFYGWQYHEIEGSMSLMERFINGDWDPEDFLVVEPGETVAATNDKQIIGSAVCTQKR